MLSSIDLIPRHVVPPSSVTNTSTSVPEAVRAGAVPPGHLVAGLGQLIVVDPPLVNSSMNPQAFAVGVGLLNVQVVIPFKVAEI